MVVEQMRDSRAVAGLERELEMHESTLHRWKRQDRVDRGMISSVGTAESARRREARRRIRDLEAELAAAKRASELFEEGREGRVVRPSKIYAIVEALGAEGYGLAASCRLWGARDRGSSLAGAVQVRERCALGLARGHRRRDLGAIPAHVRGASRAASWKDGGRSAEIWRNSVRNHAASLLDRPVDKIGAGDVLACITPIWSTKHDTAKKLRHRLSLCFRWAVAAGHRSDDPARGHAARSAAPQRSREGPHGRAAPGRSTGCAFCHRRFRRLPDHQADPSVPRVDRHPLR